MEKLNAQEFVAAAIAAAHISKKRLAALREQLEEPPKSWEHMECRASLRRLVTFMRSPHVPCPMRDVERVRWCCDPFALGRLRIRPMELQALAAVQATERYPDDFGAKKP